MHIAMTAIAYRCRANGGIYEHVRAMVVIINRCPATTGNQAMV
jgi:hypothetical protein